VGAVRQREAAPRLPVSGVTGRDTRRGMSPPGHRSVLWVCTWRSGLHRARGITTKPVERSHIPTSDRLRNSRGLKTTATAQRFLEGFEAPYALRHGHVVGVTIGGSEHERIRQLTTAFLQLGRHLCRAR